jgi:hypothetical protein
MIDTQILTEREELLQPFREEFTDKLELYRRLFADCEYLAKRILNCDNLDDAKSLAQGIQSAATFETQKLYPFDKVVDLLKTQRANNISSLRLAHQGFKAIRDTAASLEIEPSSPNAHRKTKLIDVAKEMIGRLSTTGDLK